MGTVEFGMTGGVPTVRHPSLCVSDVHGPSFAVPLPPAQRFTFPAVQDSPEDSPVEVPTVVWPACPDAATASACAEMAQAILQQLGAEPGGSGNPADRPRIVAITSPGDAEGKTGLLLALMPCLAEQAGGGILAVDADYGKRELTAGIVVPAAPVSSPVCTTKAAVPLIYPTNVPQLSVLPAAPSNESKEFDCSWFEHLREVSTLAMLDSPSLAHPEAASLAQHCDGVYLVVQMGLTARRAVAESAQVLHRVGGKLLGCLLVK